MATTTRGEHLEYALKEVRGVLVITFTGPKLPFDTREDLYDLVDVQGRAQLVLNFENVRVMTSAPIGVLVALKKKTSAIGGSVSLCRVDADLLEMLQITRTAQLFGIFDDEESAIAAFVRE